MRLNACLFAVAFLVTALPPVVRAQEAIPPPPRTAPPPPPVARPAPPPAPYPRAVPAPRYGRPYSYAPRPYYYRPHFWWGSGWGWGWYPVYGYRAPPPPSAPPADGEYAPPPQIDPADRIYTRFSVYGAGQSERTHDDGYVGGVSFGLDGRYTGFDIDVNAIGRESVTGPLHRSGSDPIAWGSAHITWSFVSERSVRLRAETGASMLSLPSSSAVQGQEWRGKTIFGPDVGVSGQIGLLGPVGIEGYARLTPFPVRVADTLIAATVHGGPVGLSAGWRWIDVAGDGIDAPKLMFRGPQVGLSVAF